MNDWLRLALNEIDTGGGGGDGGGGAPPAVADPPAPEPVAAPEPPAPYEDPGFLAAVDQRAAEMVEARLQAIAAQQPGPPEPAGPGVDLNEYLSPLSDTFGQNLATFLQQRDEYLLGQWRSQMEPFVADRQAAQDEAGAQLVDQFVDTNWNAERDGQLDPEDRAIIRELAQHRYLPEMNARYGESRIAAEQALMKAADAVRAISARARGAGAQANADHLAAVAGAHAEPGTTTGGMHVPPAPKSEKDVLAKYFGSITGVNGAQ